jgi:four helix bundle protein
MDLDNDKKHLDIDDLSSYKIAMEMGDLIWNILSKWYYFAKDTIGKQYVRCVDSVAANISEGLGRFGRKDKIVFYRYVYASLFESRTWFDKAIQRNLISKDEEKQIVKTLKHYQKKSAT